MKLSFFVRTELS
jgi:hypothetical protein